MIFFNILYNLSLLFVLIYISSFITKLFKKNNLLKIFLQGLLIGLVTIIGMKYSFVLESGLIFDGRSIIISFGTMFFGPFVGLIGAIIGIFYRIYSGGIGWLPGVLTFIVSFSVGLIFYFLKKSDEKKWTSNLSLITMGLITHIGVVSCMFVLPYNSMIKTVQAIAPIMLTIYPLFTWLLGRYQLFTEENEILAENLLNEKNRFRTALYSVGDGLITTDTLGRIVTMNEVAEKLTGWSEKDAQGKPIFDILKLINEDTRQPVANPVEKVLQYGMIVGLANHTLLINKNGEEIPIADSGAPIKDEKGNITGVVFVFRDQIAEREYLKRILKNESDLKKAEITAKIGYWEMDVATQILRGSDGTLQIFELDKEQIGLQEWRKIVLPEYHPILDKASYDLIYNDIPYNVQIIIKTSKTNSIKHIRSVAEYNKSTNQIFGVLQDITDMVVAQEKIEQEKLRFKNIVDGTKAGTWEWNVQTSEVTFNDRWFQMLGYSPEEFPNPNLDTWSKLTHPDDLIIANNLIQEHFEGKTDYYSCELRMKHKDGHWVWVLDSGSVVSRSEDGKPLWMFGQHLDITEKKLAEEQIKENEEKFRLIVENQNDLVVKVNLDNQFEFVNRAYCELFGKSQEDLIGRTFTPLVHPDDLPKTMEAMQDLFGPPYKCFVEQRALTQHGWRWLEWNDSSVVDSDGNVISIIGVGRDITEKKIIGETLEFLGNRSWNLKYEIFYEEFLYFLNNYFPSDLLLVGKIGAERTIETIQVIKNNKVIENFTLHLNENHCEDIFNETACFDDTNCCKHLLSEEIFKENNITTYDGITLYNFEGKPIGVVLLLNRNKLENKDVLKNVLKISSSRCSAEMERITYEKTLQEQAQLYKALVENLPGFVYRCKNDRNWTMEFLSSQFESITGYKTDEVVNNRVLTFNDIIHPEYRDFVWDKWQIAYENQKVFEEEYVIITKDGQERTVWERGQAIFDDTGNLVCLEGFIADVTERKQSEIKLKEIQKRMRLLYDHMVQGVVFIDKNEQITFANPAAERILGLTIDQMNGREVSDPRWKAIHEDGSEYPAPTHPSMIALHTKQEVNNAIMGVFNPVDNQYHWLNINAIPSINKNTGEVIEVLVTFEDITESYLTRKKLEENEEKYRSLVTQMEQGLAVHQAIFDEKGKMVDYIFIDINDSYTKLVGLNRDIIGKRVREVLPNIEEYWIETFAKVVETGEHVHYENYVAELDQYFEVTVYRNMPGQFAVLVTNTTERVKSRKQLEELYERLKDSEARFRLAMEATSDGLWDWNLITNEVYYSPGYFKMLGYDENDFKKHYKTWTSLLFPEDKDSAIQRVDEAIRSGSNSYSLEFRMTTKSGDWIWVLSRGKVVEWDENGKPTRLIGTHSDITARKLYEEEVLRTKETYLNIFNSVKEAIFILSSKGTFLDVNRSALHMYGYSRSEIIGQTPVFLAAPDRNDIQGLLKTFYMVFELGGTSQFEFWGKKANGEIFPKEIIVSKGKYFGQDVIIATARDITLQKQLIEELTQAKDAAIESDTLKSAFLANMSHEIRTPMNAIIGFSQFLEDDELRPDEKKEYLSIINQKGKDLLQLIDDILDLSKIEAGQLTLFLSNGDVATVVYEVVNTFKSQNRLEEYHFDKKVEIRIGKTNPTSLECKTDFYRLKQVLNNLVSNAMKFTEEGYVEVGYELIDDEIQFYVKDTGIGIHPESISKIFERFRQGDEYYQTRKYGGTGLGLSICKGIVNVLEGNIWVESEFGMGATFYFTIKYEPINYEQEQLVEKVKIPKAIKNKHLKVLIAEDEYSNFQLIRRLLEKYYEVDIIYAKNGQEAVELCELNNDIDVIFMDIRMPIKSGVQALQEIREKGYSMPVVALTAFALVEEKRNIESAGFDGYVTKPFKKEDIIDILEKLDIYNQ